MTEVMTLVIQFPLLYIICSEFLLVCIWVVSANGDKQKYTVRVPFDSTPKKVIAEAIRYRTTKLNMPAEQQQKCILEYRDSYVLKMCGSNNYLLEEHPITQYKVSRQNTLLSSRINTVHE